MGFFFFFQAEDGIRDLTVTGVQTCALPISSPEIPDPTPTGKHTALGHFSAENNSTPSVACPKIMSGSNEAITRALVSLKDLRLHASASSKEFPYSKTSAPRAANFASLSSAVFRGTTTLTL